MPRLHSKQRFSIYVLLLILCLLALQVSIFADPGGQFGRHRIHGNGERPDHGGGEAGSLAALLFGIANFPVVLSMILKPLARLLPERSGLNEKIKTLNLRQKRYLMKLHYWVNPLAIGVAVVHFWSSECRSTAMPEMGMAAMLIVSALGLMMTLKLSPPSMRRIVFNLHTNPIVSILVFSILLIGHSVID